MKSNILTICSKDNQQLQDFIETIDDIFEVIIPKKEIRNRYTSEVNDLEYWRENLPKWRTAIKMTPTDYFKAKYNMVTNEQGDLCKGYSIIKNGETDSFPEYKRIDWRSNWRLWCARIHYQNQNVLVYDFRVYSGSPYDWLETVSIMFPDLHFFIKWKQPGLKLVGSTYVYNGTVSYPD